MGSAARRRVGPRGGSAKAVEVGEEDHQELIGEDPPRRRKGTLESTAGRTPSRPP